MLIDQEITYTAETITQISGIQVQVGFEYHLFKLCFNDLNKDCIDNFEEHFEDFTKDNYYVKCMVDRLKMGGTLAAITLEDILWVTDGCHRAYAYMIETKSFLR